MGLLDGILSIGGGLLDSFFAGERQDDQQNFNQQESAAARAFNAEEAAKQRDWANWQGAYQREFNRQQAETSRMFEATMSNTAIQRRMEDLRASGINPLLAVAGSGAYAGGGPTATASIPSGSSASGQAATSGIASPGNQFANALQVSTQAEVNQAVAKRTTAEEDKVKAEADEIRARTPTYATNIEQMQQNIKESQQRVLKTIQETATSAATATNIAQQTQNLQALIPQIEATVRNLQSMSAKNYAEIKLMGTQMNLNDAQAADIKQRVQQNLPQLEAALKELQRQREVLQMPGRYQESAVHDSFVGSLSATLKALNPFTDFLNAR